LRLQRLRVCILVEVIIALIKGIDVIVIVGLGGGWGRRVLIGIRVVIVIWCLVNEVTVIHMLSPIRGEGKARE
jgi:hypothetical protein